MIGAEQIATALESPPPTQEQIDIIEAPLESMLVVAGAGSGKTETMAARVLWLVVNGYVKSDEVLGLTFTRKASIELAARLSNKLSALSRSGLWSPADADEVAFMVAPTVSTYHAYAGRIVAEHGLRLGVEPQATVLSEAACWQIAFDVVHNFPGDMSGISDSAESTLVKAVLDLSGELSEHLVDPIVVATWLTEHAAYAHALPGRDGKPPTKPGGDLGRLLERQAMIVPLVQAYRDAKRERSEVDFGDQMAIAARLARDAPAVAASERARFKAVLLDEFQDTSEAQMVLLSSLFAHPKGVRETSGVPVMAVGDPHQSIYAWRGASATTLNRFPRRFGVLGAGGELVPCPVRSLSTSWRNSSTVLAVANEIASPLRQASPVLVKEVAAAPRAGVGSVHVLRSLTHREEAREVAHWVAARWFDRDGAWTGTSAAVLCRNRAQFDTVVAALRAQHLPVEVVGLGGLLNAPELVDLVALLWAVHDPSRGDQIIRLLTGPVCRLGAADLDALWRWARHLVSDYPDESASLGEAIDQMPPPRWASSGGQTLTATARKRLTSLSSVITGLRALVGMPLPDLLVEAERSIGLDVEVAADPDTPQGWSRAHLDALIDVAAAFMASAQRPTLGGFLSWLEAARAHERALEDVEIPELAEVSVQAGSVQVMTVHAAKGLEWDIVAVPGLAQGVFPVLPGRSSLEGEEWIYKPSAIKGWMTGLGKLPYPLRGDHDGLPMLDIRGVSSTHELAQAQAECAQDGISHRVAEERRLAYVAFTRARHQMLLSAPIWSTTKSPRVTSPFLNEALDLIGRSAQVEGADAKSDSVKKAKADDALVDIRVAAWADMPTDDTEENPLAATEDAAPWPVEPGLRRATMTDLIETVFTAAFTAASAQSTRSPAPHNDATERSEIIEILLRERRNHARGDGSQDPGDVPTRLSASALLDVIADRDRFVRLRRRPMPAPPSPDADAGTAFHTWVEHHFARPSLIDFDDLGGGDFDFTSEDSAAEDMKARFLSSEWATRQPIAVEVAVTTTLAGLSVRGRIDAVFARPDGGLTVVDWKTGRPPSTAADQERKAMQLAVYRVAYARLVGRDVEDVDTAFFYASTGETVRPESLSPERLEELVRRSITPL